MASKQPFKVLFVLGVVAVMLATLCRGSGVGHTSSSDEVFKVKTRQPQDEAAEKERGGRESSDSESWAEWAKEKISGGLGLKQDDDDENNKKASDAAYDTAKNTKDKVQDTASG